MTEIRELVNLLYSKHLYIVDVFSLSSKEIDFLDIDEATERIERFLKDKEKVRMTVAQFLETLLGYPPYPHQLQWVRRLIHEDRVKVKEGKEPRYLYLSERL